MHMSAGDIITGERIGSPSTLDMTGRRTGMSKGQRNKGLTKHGSQQPTRYQKHTAIADRLRETLLPLAHTLPLVGCWMPSDWESPAEGLVQVVIAREQPDGRVAYASYLVDIYCLGVKDAHHDLNLTPDRFEAILELRSQIQPLAEAPVEGRASTDLSGSRICGAMGIQATS